MSDGPIDLGSERDRRPSKACAARVRTVDGATGWCLLASGHTGDHHGVTLAESPRPDYGPKRSQGAGKS